MALTHCKFAEYVIKFFPLLELKLQKTTDFAGLFPAPDNA